MCIRDRGADDIYQPKLWYYDQLLFLMDQEAPMMAKSSLAAASENEVSGSLNLKSWLNLKQFFWHI